ncbi:MAG: 3-keto-5-aminohexanoate cleavage protein [Rhodospirillaceae bacterium]
MTSSPTSVETGAPTSVVTGLDEADQPLLLAVAPNGARKTRADHPAVPITPDQLAAEAKACLRAGANMIHLHVRDARGGHLLDAAAYGAASAAIRSAVGEDLIVQITTEAVGIYTPDVQRAVVLETQPEAVSLGLREFVPTGSAAEIAAHGAFLATLAERGVMAQHILYDAADLDRFQRLRQDGVIPAGPVQVLFVLGRYAAGQRSHPRDLLPFLQGWQPVHSHDLWAVCAFGARETAVMAAAAALGGHIRVGFENNQTLADGTVAPDNAALVHAAAQAALASGRSPASASEIRRYCLK